MALRGSEVDPRQRNARTCRIHVDENVREKLPTKATREILLNDRALHALEKVRPLTAARSDDALAPEGTGERSEHYVRSKTGPETGCVKTTALGMKHRGGTCQAPIALEGPEHIGFMHHVRISWSIRKWGYRGFAGQ